MTYPIEIKSIGFLIDEYITTMFKDKVGVKGATSRAADLCNAIDSRLLATNWRSDGVVLELHDISQRCWDAQDRVMNPSLSYAEVAKAARDAQATNAQRNTLIREIDEKFEIGYPGLVTPLEKTYV